MNYGTYTEYKIKNWVFEKFGFLKILQNDYRHFKNMNYGTCRECQIKIWVFELFEHL